MSCWCEGNAVLTSYGAGVIIRCPLSPDGRDDYNLQQFYKVLLWRVPGKSIASASVALLQESALIMKLPVAPGMTTTLTSDATQRVEVHSYYSSRDSFLVLPVADGSPKPTAFYVVPSSQLQGAASAKFYPLLVELMRRGDQTSELVNATAQFLGDERVTKIVEKGTKLVESKSEEAKNKSKESVEKITSSVAENLPKEESMKEIYQMIKDEELTILLQKGKERLKNLMSTDISKATRDALRKTGIMISDSCDETSSFQETISKSRISALSALENFLEDAEVDKTDVEAVRKKIEANFTFAFEKLSDAAKSDRYLGLIFDNISGKTSAWQEATGRLLSTKSGSLFMEGASRLQTRAEAIFSKGHAGWAGDVGSQLIKAFTEGDAAVARLKSIEMGDAVRSRLIAAIEIRSGSHGGLDGIIAGSLSTITTKSGEGGDKMQAFLSNLQLNASGATKNARETLISVLSNQSEYQDVALMQVEKVLCDLEKNLHVGEGMTPAEIASIASGEGGTAALFEPIAKRASMEISKHLDQVENTMKDPAILSTVKHVRRIISGEMTMSGLMDEVVNILNDESILSAGEGLMKTGEIALDAIEGISSNKLAGNVMEIVEKAGITKESLMSQIQSLNVNEILDTAGNAVTDEHARQQLVSSATDTALDFVLRILPSMPVPPFEGVKDGLLYHLSNLSMEGFKVKKHNIFVEIAGMTATKHGNKSIDSSEPHVIAKKMEEEVTHSENIEPSMTAGLPAVVKSVETVKDVKATELLIIDVQGISAILDNVVWSFEQTYMPYLKGGGKANVKLSEGSIRLQFELRKRKVEPLDDSKCTNWEPVLCLHDRACSIEQVDLSLVGESRLTWIFNKLATLFKGVICDYVVKTIIGMLSSKSGYILEQLNENLSPHWDLILRTTGLQMDDLVEADDEVITSAQIEEDDALLELVWRENLPLGMNLLLNDTSGKLKVVDFPRGSQARAVCTEKEIEPEIFNGATIVAVNGSRYDFQDDLFEALKHPSRPKAILFQLANPDDAARVKKFVEGSRGRRQKAKKSGKEVLKAKARAFSTREIVISEEMEIGLEFAPSDDLFALSVKAFVEGEGRTVLAAERHGSVKIGDILTHVNGKLVLGKDNEGQKRAFELLEAEGCTRPLCLAFTEPYLIRQKLEKSSYGITDLGGPVELKLKEVNKRVLIDEFENVSGTAESGGVLIGDHLVFINGMPVGAGCALVGQHQPPELSEVYQILRTSSNYPAALTFARPKQESGSRWTTAANSRTFSAESAETICVTADCFEQIGCVLESAWNLDIVISDFFAVPGPLQLAMRDHVENNGREFAIESINGQFVPSYATKSIVMNAMKRSWQDDRKFELVFCDDERKKWVYSLK